MARARQTIRIRVRKGSTSGPIRPCGTCGGTGLVRNHNGNGLKK